MSCFFLCKKSDAYSSYQTADSESGTEGSDSTPGTDDTSLTALSTIGELSNQERAEFVSFARVAACMINEKLVDSIFTDETVTISHPNSTDRITVKLAEKPIVPSYVHHADLRSEITYNEIQIHLKGSCMMSIFGRWAGLDVSKLLAELENSALNLEAAYNNPPVVSFDSPSIDWEQSIIEGHLSHPWHKCRYPEVNEFKTAKLYFVTIPRDRMEVVGEYSDWMKQLVKTSGVGDDQVILPVHELQLPNVLDTFPEVQVLPQTMIGRPQSSLRTISIASPNFCVKVPLPIKITSMIRTIRPWAITIGHRLEPVLQVVEKAVQAFGGSLIVAREFAAAASKSEHLGCIIRESTESIAARTGDRIIVCSAMIEHIDVTWGKDFDKTLVLREFCKHMFRVTLPSVLLHGFALQAHLQNLLIRLDPVSRAIKGFVARDLGSLKVHRPTLFESTSLDIDTSWTLTSLDSLEKVYVYIFGVMHANVDSMVRALKLGMEGWKIARAELEIFVLPGDNLARRTWLDQPMGNCNAYVSTQLFGVDNACRLASIPNKFYHCQHI